MGSHHYVSKAARSFFPWALGGWATGWFAGLPMLEFYFPFPYLLIWLLEHVTGYEVAFKLVTVLGTFGLPVAAWLLFRLMGAPKAARAIAPAAAVAFLFVQGHGEYTETKILDIFGGFITSTMAGEFSYSLGLTLTLVAVALIFRATRRACGSAPALGSRRRVGRCRRHRGALAHDPDHVARPRRTRPRRRVHDKATGGDCRGRGRCRDRVRSRARVGPDRLRRCRRRRARPVDDPLRLRRPRCGDGGGARARALAPRGRRGGQWRARGCAGGVLAAAGVQPAALHRRWGLGERVRRQMAVAGLALAAGTGARRRRRGGPVAPPERCARHRGSRPAASRCSSSSPRARWSTGGSYRSCT